MKNQNRAPAVLPAKANPWLRKIGGGVLLCALMTAVLIQGASAQENWETLYEDGFDSGSLSNWEYAGGWAVQQEDGNYVLSAPSNAWAVLKVGSGWEDFSFACSLKISRGIVHLNYRTSDLGRYFVGFHAQGLYLMKEHPLGTFEELASEGTENTLNAWAEVEITGVGGSLTISVGGQTRLQYVDADPVGPGSIGLETLDDTSAYFDKITISGEPPPEAPEGFEWTRTGGPSGGLGYDIRIDPSDKQIMYVTDNPSGVNKSTDAGQTWIKSNEGITDRTGPSLDGVPIFSLTIDPSAPDIVWAGTQVANGIYRSTDGGASWTKKVSGITEGNEISFRNFGIHPQNSNIVFAGAEISTGELGREFDKTRGRIYRTTDSGDHWESVWEGDNLVRFILFDYENPEVLYASTGIFDREAYNTDGLGLLKSTDGGDSWMQINSGIPSADGNLFFGFLEMHPENPAVLLAASGNNAAGNGGLFKTTNGGQSWTQVLSGDIFTVVTFSPSRPDILYAGSAGSFYRSDNGGRTWRQHSKQAGEWGPPGIRAGVPISAVVDPDDPETLFANNYGGGIFKSTDGARTWTNASDGYTGAAIHWISIDARQPGLVFAIGRSGPFRSTDGGAHWDGIGFSPAGFAEWNTIACSPAANGVVLAADEHEGNILRSTDWGRSWDIVYSHPSAARDNSNPQYDRHGFKAFAYAPGNPSIVYAGMRKGRRTIDGDFPADASFGMYKSTDSGLTWAAINRNLDTAFINIHHIAVHPSNSDIAYIGTWRDGVFKTTDGGQSWQLKSSGLVSADVRCLAIDPQSPDTVYAGLGEGGGVFKTTDGGELWGEINTGLRTRCPGYLLPAGRVNPGMSLRSPPRRRSSADYYSVPWTSVRSIAIDPENPGTLYAGDYNSGVYRSTNGGAGWLPINENLSTRAVTSLAVSADGRVLYAATDGEGVFRIGTVSPVTLPGEVTGPDTNSPCIAEVLFGSNSPEVARLRQFRDRFLTAAPGGRSLTALYYRASALIVSLAARRGPAGEPAGRVGGLTAH